MDTITVLYKTLRVKVDKDPDMSDEEFDKMIEEKYLDIEIAVDLGDAIKEQLCAKGGVFEGLQDHVTVEFGQY